MGWLDHQEESQGSSSALKSSGLRELEIKIPGQNAWLTVNKNQVYDIYEDEFPALLVIIDECAELLMPSGLKTEEGKEMDQLKQECVTHMQSVTQLGRAAGMHMNIATQRNDTSIIPGVIQNNPVAVDTKIRVLRKKKVD